MRQSSLFLLILLTLFTACSTYTQPTPDGQPANSPATETNAEPTLNPRVEADLEEAETSVDIIDFGRRAYEEGRYEDASQLFLEVLKDSPDDHVARYSLGLSYYRLGRFEEAKEAFAYMVERMKELDTTGSLYELFNPNLLRDARVNLGMSYMQMGQPEQAVLILLDAMPDETAHYNLIVAYDRLGDSLRVTSFSQDYIRIYGENANLYNLMGLIYYRQEKYQQALEAFENAVTNEPENAEMQVNLGHLYMLMERNEEAEATFEKATTLDPKLNLEEYLDHLKHAHEREARIYYNRGNQLHAEGDIKGAISAYSQAVALYPGFVQAHINLGVAYLNRKRVDDSIKHLKQATELDRESFEAFYNLGISYSQRRRYAEAADAFGHAVTLQPSHAKAQYNLGIAFSKSNRLEAAVEAFQKAIELSPTWPDPRLDLGRILGDLFRFDEGIEVLRALLEFQPRHAEAYYNLAVLYLGLDDQKQALEAAENAVLHNPNNKRAQRLADRLKNQRTSDEK